MGFAIESHGHAHIDYARSEPAAVRDDVRASVERLGEILGRPPRYLAYPYGRATEAAADEAARSGYRPGSCSTVHRRSTGDFAMRTGLDRPGGRQSALRAQDGGPIQRVAPQPPGAGGIPRCPADRSQPMALAVAYGRMRWIARRTARCTPAVRSAWRADSRPRTASAETGARADAAFEELVRSVRERELVRRVALAEVDLTDAEGSRGPSQLQEEHEPGRVLARDLGCRPETSNATRVAVRTPNWSAGDLVARVQHGQRPGELRSAHGVHALSSSRLPASASTSRTPVSAYCRRFHSISRSSSSIASLSGTNRTRADLARELPRGLAERVTDVRALAALAT